MGKDDLDLIIILHKCVEDIEVQPKLKLSEKQSVGFAPLHNIDYLQEFQYGYNMFQTTTNNIRKHFSER